MKGVQHPSAVLHWVQIKTRHTSDRVRVALRLPTIAVAMGVQATFIRRGLANTLPGVVNSFVGKVEEAEFLGAHAAATIRVGSDLLRVNTTPHEVFEAGRPVRLTLPPERPWIVDDVGGQQ